MVEKSLQGDDHPQMEKKSEKESQSA